MKLILAPGDAILRQLTNTELQDLIRLYKSTGDKYHCMSIYNHCHWSGQLENVDGNCSEKYTPFKKIYYTHRYGNLAANGTYISLQWDEVLSVQFHTLEESLQELRECILKTELIDWKSGPLLTAIHTKFADEIVEIITKLGGKFDYAIPCTCFVLPQSNALRIQVPSVVKGFEVRSLQDGYADLVHDQWPHKESASVDFIRGMLAFNIALGVFRLSDNKLIAWALQNEFYGLGLLQVIPEEKGKGFGKLLTLALSRKIAINDENDITAFVVVGNAKPESIFKKAGYERHCVATWVQFKQLSTC